MAKIYRNVAENEFCRRAVRVVCVRRSTRQPTSNQLRVINRRLHIACSKQSTWTLMRSSIVPFTVHHYSDKKHLKNVGPIRHCEPPHAHSPGVASGTVVRRLRIDVHDNNDNAWQRGPLWRHGMGPITQLSRVAAALPFCSPSAIDRRRKLNGIVGVAWSRDWQAGTRPLQCRAVVGRWTRRKRVGFFVQRHSTWTLMCRLRLSEQSISRACVITRHYFTEMSRSVCLSISGQ